MKITSTRILIIVLLALAWAYVFHGATQYEKRLEGEAVKSFHVDKATLNFSGNEMVITFTSDTDFSVVIDGNDIPSTQHEVPAGLEWDEYHILVQNLNGYSQVVVDESNNNPLTVQTVGVESVQGEVAHSQSSGIFLGLLFVLIWGFISYCVLIV